MTFLELDQRIRVALPDGIERRQILEGLHEIEEGANQTLGWILSITNHRLQDDGETWKKTDHTRFQVNARLT